MLTPLNNYALPLPPCFLPTTTTMSSTNTSFNDQRNADIRDTLLHSGLYLGDHDLLQHVHWEPNGRKDSLFITEPPPPTEQSAGSLQKNLATLSTVVQISHNNFWLMSDAGWRGSTKITPHLHDAKATCVGVAPRDTPIFLNDFLIAVENAKNLQQQTATPDLQMRYGFACNGEGQFTEFKFRHVLFEVCFVRLQPYVCSQCDREPRRKVTTTSLRVNISYFHSYN
jgi:hypothetical protein